MISVTLAPGRIGPREGLDRFISAMSEMPSSTSASEKGRLRRDGPSRRSRSPAGTSCLRRASSASVRSTTVSRKVATGRAGV
jgi:hypothetical protein